MLEFEMKTPSDKQEETEDIEVEIDPKLESTTEICQFIHNLVKKNIEDEALANKTFRDKHGAFGYVRELDDTYILLNDDFILPSIYFNTERSTAKNAEQRIFELAQYASIYYQRIEKLRPSIQNKAFEVWGKDYFFVDHILDIQPFQKAIIVGTIYKEMHKKPCILNNLMGVLGSWEFIDYVTEGQDYWVIEDSSGRVKIVNSENFKSESFVTGIVVALRGFVNSVGQFEVFDYVLPGIPNLEYKIPDSWTGLKLNSTKRDLYNNLEKRKFAWFISGLELGIENQEKMSIDFLVRFLEGEFGSYKEKLLSSRISRLILWGNNIKQPKNSDEVLRGSYKTSSINHEIYSKLFESMTEFESILLRLSQIIDIDVMPGESDFTTSFWPQQPFNSCLFPNLHESKTINLTTNPHKFKIGDKLFLGTSGHSILDMRMFSKCCPKGRESKSQKSSKNGSSISSSFDNKIRKDRITYHEIIGTETHDEILEEDLSYQQLLLQIRHLCPTWPDTLRGYPFTDSDPFVVKYSPHLFFTGNQRLYGERLIPVDQDNCDDYDEGINPNLKGTPKTGNVKILSIPKFSRTKWIVLVDLETLETYDLNFDVSLIFDDLCLEDFAEQNENINIEEMQGEDLEIS